MTNYQRIPPKREDEDWKSYCRRQKAYITMLEGGVGTVQRADGECQETRKAVSQYERVFRQVR